MSLEQDILTICAWCEKQDNRFMYRTQAGLWWEKPFEELKPAYEGYKVSHGMCPTHYQLEKDNLRTYLKLDGDTGHHETD